MKYLIIIAALFLNKAASSQIIFKGVENKESKNTILKLNQYLLLHPSPEYTVDLKDPQAPLKGSEKYCDSIINLFYDKNRLDSLCASLKENNSMRSLQNISLSVLGKFLRCLPQDSICIMSEAEFDRTKEMKVIDSSLVFKNIYIAGFITKSSFNDYFMIILNDESKKIISISPIIQFEGRPNNEAEEFLERHCKDLRTKNKNSTEIVPAFIDNGKTIDSLKQAYNCEDITFDNWGDKKPSDSCLTVCLINSATMPAPNDFEKSDAALTGIARSIKKALANPKAYKSYYIIFVKKEKSAWIESKSHTNGMEIRSEEL